VASAPVGASTLGDPSTHTRAHRRHRGTLSPIGNPNFSGNVRHAESQVCLADASSGNGVRSVLSASVSVVRASSSACSRDGGCHERADLPSGTLPALGWCLDRVRPFGHWTLLTPSSSQSFYVEVEPLLVHAQLYLSVHATDSSSKIQI
jgi:hypothetical protein